MRMLALLLLAATPAFAAVRYVNLNNPAPAPPYGSWASAATNIQDALDAAQAGDTVLVTNGVYATGGRAVDGLMTNRVAVTQPVRLESVNGPAVTVIRGYQVPGAFEGLGDGAVRCVYLADGAVLAGFTLTNGAAVGVDDGQDFRETSGGGVWCASMNAVVTNCVLTGNSAYIYGGGAYSGTLDNCSLIGNYAYLSGGGASGSMLNHCTLLGNSARFFGGGAYGSVLNNCTLNGNSVDGDLGGCDSGGGGAAECVLNNCTLSGNSALRGEGGGAKRGTLNNCTLTGNSAGDAGGGVLECALNNCVVYYNVAPAGANYSGGTLNYSCTTPLPPEGVGNITNEPEFVDLANGNLRLRPGSPCIDAGSNLSAVLTNDLDGRPRPLDGNGDGIAAFDMGAYEYRVLHVWQGSPSPAPPYTNWTSAATNIQDAIDAALAGDTVLVTNGVYATGGRAVDGLMTNRVAVTQPVRVESVNGPAVTVIAGRQVPRGFPEFGDGAVRCVYLADGAVLAGFTLTNGATRTSGSEERELSGGGVWCASVNPVVTNCTLTGNSAYYLGGGAFNGTLNNCTLTHNWASEGGGATTSTLNDCTLTGNSAIYGGGAAAGTLNNCTLIGNSATWAGGGAYGDPYVGNGVTLLNNCTLTGNSAYSGGGAYGERVDGGGTFVFMNNCIVYENVGTQGGANYGGPVFCNYTCTTPLPTDGTGNITNAPGFADYAGGNLRLQSNSPCINAGFNAYAPAGPDLDGLPRVAGGTVDMGAYEFRSPGSLISYAWLQKFGLPTDGSADHADPDGDRLTNWQEWRCGTHPTDALSALRLLPPQRAGADVRVRWASVPGRSYVLEASPNLSAPAPFAPLAGPLPADAVAGTTAFTHTNAAGPGPWFYRVRMEDAP